MGSGLVPRPAPLVDTEEGSQLRVPVLPGSSGRLGYSGHTGVSCPRDAIHRRFGGTSGLHIQDQGESKTRRIICELVPDYTALRPRKFHCQDFGQTQPRRRRSVHLKTGVQFRCDGHPESRLHWASSCRASVGATGLHGLLVLLQPPRCGSYRPPRPVTVLLQPPRCGSCRPPRPVTVLLQPPRCGSYRPPRPVSSATAAPMWELQASTAC
jgi:hypothetical protein